MYMTLKNKPSNSLPSHDKEKHEWRKRKHEETERVLDEHEQDELDEFFNTRKLPNRRLRNNNLK
jgi:hypothetical protein